MKQDNRTAEDMGYILFSDKKPNDKQKIIYWESGEKEGVYDAVNNHVIGRYKLPKHWKPLPEHPQPTDTGNTVSSEVGFTGGDWYAKGQNIYVTLDGERAQVASAFSPETMHSIREYNDKAQNNEAESNARLIAAAPALVSALKKNHQWALCLLADIEAGNVEYDEKYLQELNQDISETTQLLTTINQTK